VERRVLVSTIAVCVAALGLVGIAGTSASATTKIPSSPRTVRGAPGNASAVVSWVKPTSNGGAPIDSYEVITYLNESPRPINVFHSSKTTETIISLTNGRTYTFKVAAHNAAGWSRLSSESPSVLIGVPGSPANVIAAPGNAQVKLSWTAPTITSGSAIQAYRITPHTGTKTLATRTYNSKATTELVTGLTNGTVYAFDVAARNGRGWGPPSAVSPDVEVGVPVAPTHVAAVGGDGQATVSWTAPTASNGSSISAYRVTPYLGSTAEATQTFDASETTRGVIGLANGKAYRFRVEARNARGWSPRSAASALVNIGVPGITTGVTAVAASGQARVSWTAPAFTNGAPVGAYEIVPYRNGVAQAAQVFSSPAVSQIVRGLGHGVPFRFRVAAHNSRGWGPLSAPSASVTPT
jgi:hypothetical protein